MAELDMWSDAKRDWAVLHVHSAPGGMGRSGSAGQEAIRTKVLQS